LHQLYRIVIGYFLLFTLLLLLSALALFVHKQGFSSEGIMHYYQGNSECGINPKSIEGLREILIYHIGSIALLIMVLAHFFLFANTKIKSMVAKYISILYSAAAVIIIAPFIILYGFSSFAYIKILALVILLGGLTFLLLLLGYFVFIGLKKSST
jgi:hypothetical protein